VCFWSLVGQSIPEVPYPLLPYGFPLRSIGFVVQRWSSHEPTKRWITSQLSAVFGILDSEFRLRQLFLLTRSQGHGLESSHHVAIDPRGGGQFKGSSYNGQGTHFYQCPGPFIVVSTIGIGSDLIKVQARRSQPSLLIIMLVGHRLPELHHFACFVVST
jgi:hypothetical protein